MPKTKPLKLIDFQPCNIKFDSKYDVLTRWITCAGLRGLIKKELTKEARIVPDTPCFYVFQINKYGLGNFWIATDGEKYFDVACTGYGENRDLTTSNLNFTVSKSTRQAKKCPDIMDRTIIQAFIAAEATGETIPLEI